MTKNIRVKIEDNIHLDSWMYKTNRLQTIVLLQDLIGTSKYRIQVDNKKKM